MSTKLSGSSAHKVSHPHCGLFEDGTWDITQISDFTDLVLQASRNRAWKQAGERNRDNLLNIRQGVNVEEALQFYKIAKTPGQRGRTRTTRRWGLHTLEEQS